MPKQLCAANWKMHKSPTEAEAFFDELKSSDYKCAPDQLLFFVPDVDLPAAASSLTDMQMGWGPQNISTEDQGAFTGETSPMICKSMGATHALIGHSERRQLFGEDNSQVALKLKAAVKNNLIPVVCIGELLVQRDAGSTLDVLRQQLTEGLSGFKGDAKNLVIAYEPVWAIGTGKVATPEMAEETHVGVRAILADIFDSSTASEMTILYGGSVKPENAASLIEQKNIDGFLVGGASLKVQSFLGIAQVI